MYNVISENVQTTYNLNDITKGLTQSCDWIPKGLKFSFGMQQFSMNPTDLKAYLYRSKENPSLYKGMSIHKYDFTNQNSKKKKY